MTRCGKLLSKIMYDVAEVMNVSKKRAKRLADECYKQIARLQQEDVSQQVDGVIEHVTGLCKSESEYFLTGFLLGRIVQINETALEGAAPFFNEHLASLEKATEKMREHPEFG